MPNRRSDYEHVLKLGIEQLIDIQKNLGEKNQAMASSKQICPNRQVVMSRRSLKKPDNKTGLTEVTYRCPKCSAAINRFIKD